MFQNHFYSLKPSLLVNITFLLLQTHVSCWNHYFSLQLSRLHHVYCSHVCWWNSQYSSWKKTISDTVVHTLYILESQFSTCLMVKSNILPSLNHHQWIQWTSPWSLCLEVWDPAWHSKCLLPRGANELGVGCGVSKNWGNSQENDL